MENNESCGAGRSANSAYVLDNAGKEASVRLAALAAILDPGTIRHLEERGITSGWHCLEVGGGGGLDKTGSYKVPLAGFFCAALLSTLLMTPLRPYRYRTDATPVAAVALTRAGR